MTVRVVGAAAFAWLGQTGVGLLRDGDYWRAWPLVASTAAYASAIAAILLALRFIARDAEPARLRPAFWLLFTLLGAALSVARAGRRDLLHRPAAARRARHDRRALEPGGRAHRRDPGAAAALSDASASRSACSRS